MQPDSIKKLLNSIKCLKQTEVKTLIDTRIREFKETGQKPNDEIFKELCFCILCANYTAERSIKIQAEVGDGFLYLPERQMVGRLKALGYRFPNARARYIVEARKYMESLKSILASINNKNDIREWLIVNIRGIGPKEASHFLRNIGHTDFAILDFHIINILVKYNLIEKPKSLTKKYLEIEELLRRIAKKAQLTLAELDLYLWFMETRKVLK